MPGPLSLATANNSMLTDPGALASTAPGDGSANSLMDDGFSFLQRKIMGPSSTFVGCFKALTHATAWKHANVVAVIGGVLGTLVFIALFVKYRLAGEVEWDTGKTFLTCAFFSEALVFLMYAVHLAVDCDKNLMQMSVEADQAFDEANLMVSFIQGVARAVHGQEGNIQARLEDGGALSGLQKLREHLDSSLNRAHLPETAAGSLKALATDPDLQMILRAADNHEGLGGATPATSLLQKVREAASVPGLKNMISGLDLDSLSAVSNEVSAQIAPVVDEILAASGKLGKEAPTSFRAGIEAGVVMDALLPEVLHLEKPQKHRGSKE